MLAISVNGYVYLLIGFHKRILLDLIKVYSDFKTTESRGSSFYNIFIISFAKLVICQMSELSERHTGLDLE